MMVAIPTLTDLQDTQLAARVQQRIDQLTKPLGALGRLEALALQMALVQGSTHPRLQAPQLLVFAADHGIAAQGVSAYPSAVTAQMVSNMLAGGAAVSVLARQQGLALTVVDCGVDADLPAHPCLVDAKVCRGSADSSRAIRVSIPPLARSWVITHSRIFASAGTSAFHWNSNRLSTRLVREDDGR